MKRIQRVTPGFVIGFAVACVTVYPSIAQAAPRVRRNYKTEQGTIAGQQRLTDFVAAIKALKAVEPTTGLLNNGLVSYNDFIRMHGEQVNSLTSCAPDCPAHGGPAFLAWHRLFMLRFEDRLREMGPQFVNVTIPYWDWTTTPFPKDIVTGDNMFMGPTGVSGNSYIVPLGPFGFSSGGWQCYAPPQAGYSTSLPLLASYGIRLKRNNGGGTVSSLPIASDVACALKITPFDSPNWTSASSNFLGLSCSSPADIAKITSFRNFLEGKIGPGLHDSVHGYIGGGVGHMGRIPVAINDPVFWLHHANIDRLWCDWQVLYPNEFHHLPLGGVYSPHYHPPERANHHVFDQMTPFKSGEELDDPRNMPFDVMNMVTLDYVYDEGSAGFCSGPPVCPSGTGAVGLTASQIFLKKEV